MKHTITCLLLAVLVLTQGCASFMHHTEYMASTGTDPQATMPSPIFPGVVEDLKLTGGLLSSPVTYRTGLNENWWDFVYFPLPLLDLAPSLVLDVLWLPSDIIYWINH